MSEEKLLSKKQLRERGWTHRQIRELGVPKERIKTEWRGRPAYGFSLVDVETSEKNRK